MNSIKAYKALSVVANVEQGALVKRLILENEMIQLRYKEIKKHNKYLERVIDNRNAKLQIWARDGANEYNYRYMCGECCEIVRGIGYRNEEPDEDELCEECVIDGYSD